MDMYFWAAMAMVVLHSGYAQAGLPNAVPEPASVVLLAGGLGALAIVKFRKRK